jgi:putative transposase
MRTGQKKKYGKFRLRLTAGDRRKLNRVLMQGQGSARLFKRAMILRLLDLGKSVGEVAKDVGVSRMAPRIVGTRYLKQGLDRALSEAPRPGKPSLINGHAEKEIVALVCSSPPGERVRWTLNLLRDELIRRGIVPSIGRETLRIFLHEARVKPWLEKNVVHWGADR